jgi:putative endonuclease
MVNTQHLGSSAETLAWGHLQKQGLTLLERNFRVAAGPNRRAGEIDLIVRERDGTLVFVEVRSRKSASQGGAAASVVRSKQRSLALAAQHYLQRLASPPPCRFDVVAVDGEQVQWIRAAFDNPF